MRTTACPAPAFGVGISSSFMTSGAPNSCTTIAFIFVSLRWKMAAAESLANANSVGSREQSQMDHGLGGTGFSLWGLLDAQLPCCYKNPQAEACATQTRKP